MPAVPSMYRLNWGGAMEDRFTSPDRLRWLLWRAAAVLFGLMAVAAFFYPAGAWPLCVAGVACMVFANIDRVSAISASTSGINIALSRAEVSIAQMTRLIRTSAVVQLATVQRSGRWGGFSSAEKDKYLEEAMGLLRDAGVSEADIRELRYEPWDRFVIFDYVSAILGGAYTPDPHYEAAHAEWKGLQTIDNIPSADKLRAFLLKYNAITPEREELLLDLSYYVEHRRHRRPDYAEHLSRGATLEHRLRLTMPGPS